MNERRRLFLFLAVAWLASFGCAGWHLNDAPRSTRLDSDPTYVDVWWSKNLPIVSVDLGSPRPYRFLLDTGAEGTVVSPTCTREAKLQTVKRTAGIGGAVGKTRRELETTTIPELQLGGARFAGIPAIVDNVAPGLDGILGFPVFADLLLTLDGPERRVVLERGRLPTPASCPSCLALEPGRAEHGSPHAWGSIAGQPALFLIDSGFDGILYLATGIPENAHLNFEPGPGEEVSVRTRLGVHEVAVGRLMERVELGQLGFENLPTMVGMGGPVILGGGFLRDLVTTLDQKNQRIRFLTDSQRPTPRGR